MQPEARKVIVNLLDEGGRPGIPDERGRLPRLLGAGVERESSVSATSLPLWSLILVMFTSHFALRARKIMTPP